MDMPDYKAMYEAERARYEDLSAKRNDERRKHEEATEILYDKIRFLESERDKLTAQLDIVRLIFGK